MALIWSESTQRIRESSYDRAYTLGSASWSATDGRNGGPAITISLALIAYPTTPAPVGNRIIFGMRFKSSGATNSRLMSVGNGLSNTVNPFTGAAVWVNISTDGRVQIRRGVSTILAETAAGVISAGTLYYLAADITIDATAGATRVTLDGGVLADLTLTGVNTADNGESSWNSFAMQTSGGSYICDIYVFDGDPNGPNELVPDMRVDWVPVNGNGYSSQFDGSDGNQVNNYQQLDEVASGSPDDDTTYNEASAAAIDGYTLAAAPEPGATIVGVTAFAHARKTDAGTAPFAVGLRRASTNFFGDTVYLPVSNIDVREHFGRDPATGSAWTESNFNATEHLIQRP